MSARHNGLHDSVVAAIDYIRDRLGSADIGAFYFHVSTSGRTLTDRHNVMIEYRLGEREYDSDAVRGNSLITVVDEFLRRKGWSSVNAPLSIGYDE